jgi:hypothetical protein
LEAGVQQVFPDDVGDGLVVLDKENPAVTGLHSARTGLRIHTFSIGSPQPPGTGSTACVRIRTDSVITG